MTFHTPPSMVSQALSSTNGAFYRYWSRLAKVQRPPRKSSVNPADIRKILSHLVIYERREPTVFQIRLMGTKTTQRLGLDLTGRNLLDFCCYSEKDQAREDLNRIVDGPVGQFLIVKDRFTSGREAWVEIVRLPLTDEEGDVRFIIGSTEEKKTTGFAGPGRDTPVLLAERIKGFFFDLDGRVRTETAWKNQAASGGVGGDW